MIASTPATTGLQRRKVQKMKKTVLLSILLVLGQLGSPSRAQAQEDIAKQLAGMWRLVSNPQRLVDGTTREGANSVGYAFFRMSLRVDSSELSPPVVASTFVWERVVK